MAVDISKKQVLKDKIDGSYLINKSKIGLKGETPICSKTEEVNSNRTESEPVSIEINRNQSYSPEQMHSLKKRFLIRHRILFFTMQSCALRLDTNS